MSRRTPLAVQVLPGLDGRLLHGRGWQLECRADYERAGGYSGSGVSGLALIDAVEQAGLRGRGGAAFPTATKLRAVAGRPGPRFLVINGEEGEPASLKDRWLQRARPQLVLDGALRVARAVGIEKAFFYLSDSAAAASVAEALRGHGGSELPIELIVVAAGYVAGEETSAVRAINGGPARPTAKPPRPFEAGVGGSPTLVLNVETLANIPQIAVEGPQAFRALGSSSSPGTFLCTLSGAVERPGLYELPLGITLGRAVEASGGFAGTPRGVLMGGFFGGLLGPRALGLPLAYDELRAAGSGLGCGAVVVLGERDCPVGAAADVMAYFSRENAKQCGACMRGTEAMRDVLFELVEGCAGEERLERLRAWSATLPGRGACGTLDAAAGLAASLLREFPAEVEAHRTAACADCAALDTSSLAASTRFILGNVDRREAEA